MNKTLKTAAIITLAGVVLYYPAMRLYEYIAGKLNEKKDDLADKGESHLKLFAPAFRGKRKHHLRHDQNGHTGSHN